MSAIASKNLYSSNYLHRLDDKARVAVPGKWRPDKVLGEEPKTRLMMVPRTADALNPVRYSCYQPDYIDRKIAEIDAEKIDDIEKEHRRRQLVGRADDVTLDSQGRIILSEKARKHLGVRIGDGPEAEVVFVGMWNFFEIWSKDQWDIYAEEGAELITRAKRGGK
jgi:division/cell wall cluster transcriptional repressor MraZ